MDKRRQQELSDRIRRFEGMKAQAKLLCQDSANLEFIILGVDTELKLARETMEKESDHHHRSPR